MDFFNDYTIALLKRILSNLEPKYMDIIRSSYSRGFITSGWLHKYIHCVLLEDSNYIKQKIQ